MAKTFTDRSADRIARAVRKVEGMQGGEAAATPFDPRMGFTETRRFELQEAMAAGQRALAYALAWNSATSEFEVNSAIQFYVRGLDTTTTLEDEQRGIAVKAVDHPDWDVVAVDGTAPYPGPYPYPSPTTEYCEEIIVSAVTAGGETTTTGTVATGLAVAPNPGDITPVPPTLPTPAWCVSTDQPFAWDYTADLINPGYTWDPGDLVRLRLLPDGTYLIQGVAPSTAQTAVLCTACSHGFASSFGYEIVIAGISGAASLNDTFTVAHVDDITYCRWEVDIDPNTHAGVAHVVHLIWWNWVAEEYERSVYFYSDELDEFDAYIPLVGWYDYFEVALPNCLPVVGGNPYAMPLTQLSEPVNDLAAAFRLAVDCSASTCTVEHLTA